MAAERFFEARKLDEHHAVAAFVGQLSNKQLFPRRQVVCVYEAPVPLIKSECLVRCDRAHGIAVPREQVQLREFGGNDLVAKVHHDDNLTH